MTCGQSVLIPILETGKTAYETHLHIIHLTATVLGYNEFGQTADVVALGILAAVHKWPALWWGAAGKLNAPFKVGDKIDVLYNYGRNTFNGVEGRRLVIVDARKSVF